MISYIRVSTVAQGKSGLGLEAQRATIAAFAKSEGLEVAREFVEVETGKGSDALERRPQLRQALATAKKLKCAVVVAKLDRHRWVATQIRLCSISTRPWQSKSAL